MTKWFTKYVIGERDSWGRKWFTGYLRFARWVWLYLTPVGWSIMIMMSLYKSVMAFRRASMGDPATRTIAAAKAAEAARAARAEKELGR